MIANGMTWLGRPVSLGYSLLGGDFGIHSAGYQHWFFLLFAKLKQQEIFSQLHFALFLGRCKKKFHFSLNIET
jgi:hypothetical protein